MFIFERRLTVRIVVDRSLYIFWRQQNWVSYYATIRLRMIYLFERRSSLYYYYRVLKFQLHATYNWRIILVNTLYSLLWISNIRSLLISQYLWQQHFCSSTSKNIKHLSISIVWALTTNSEKERLQRIAVIEQNNFWNDSIKAHYLQAISIIA